MGKVVHPEHIRKQGKGGEKKMQKKFEYRNRQGDEIEIFVNETFRIVKKVNRTTGKQTIVTLPVAIATEDEVREIMARDEADQIRTF